MSKAISGSILISSTVKDLVVGSGFQFKPSGSVVTNTLGEWGLYELAGG
jgi:hypothetical protein